MKAPVSNIEAADFLAGELILINKPLGWTSFDVVNKLRYALRRLTQVKKIKVGHSGTLDPMATGLLQICTGKMTKQIESLQGLDKVYSGSFAIGATTPSFDSESEVDQTYPIDHISEEDLLNAAKSFIGPQEQIPPMFSAIKVDGQPLYIAARKGIKKEIKPRPINILDFQITNIQLPKVNFLVACSKGTYIRSLAYDFGKALKSGAYLTSLVREKIGNYSLDQAWDLNEIIEQLDLLTKEGGTNKLTPPPSSQ